MTSDVSCDMEPYGAYVADVTDILGTFGSALTHDNVASVRNMAVRRLV